MQKSFKPTLLSIIAIALTLILPQFSSRSTASFAPIAQATTTEVAATQAPAVSTTVASSIPAPRPVTSASVPDTSSPEYPTLISIPSIGLRDQIIPVGLNAKGEMDVPSGNTQNVGWYKDGTMPGNVGSAVLDAHVFAAFTKLHNVTPGEDIYVTTNKGRTIHFQVQETDTYALSDVPADTLFNRADQSRLNLITCAGSLTPDHSTYDHRFVAYATLVP